MAWIRSATRIPVKVCTTGNKTWVNLKSFKKGVNDIVERKVCPPRYVPTALEDTISRRGHVAASYAQAEGSDLSKSTLGHQHFLAELFSMKAILDTIETPDDLVATATSVPNAPDANAFDVLEDTMDVAFEGDELWQELKVVSEGIWQLAYLLVESMTRFKSSMTSPSALAEAAWVAVGAHALAMGICASIQLQTGIHWPGLLELITELHAKGNTEALRVLPIHEYMKQFEHTAKEAIANPSPAVAYPRILKPALAKTIQKDLQNPQHSSVPNDDEAWLSRTWLKKFPLARTFVNYVNSRTKANALLATVEAMFLLQTTAAAASISSSKMFEKSFQQVLGFASSVKRFIRTIPSLVLKLFETSLLRELDDVSNLCDLVEKLRFSTATSFPWTLGNQVLAILQLLNHATATTIHQHKVVGAIFGTLMKILQTEVFPENAQPTDNFCEAFSNYANRRPPVSDGVFTSDDGKRGSPSIVHQCPFPVSDALMAKNDLRKKLRGASADPATLPNAADWNIVHVMQQLRYTANQEFNGDIPVAQVNFIAIFLLCIELLTAFNQSLDAPLDSEVASRMVDRTTKVLEELDSTGTTVVHATGQVAALVAAFRNFDHRSQEDLLWEKL
ncbi:hypothetical protein P171DRAFT_486082 [Karstenula rhodostoma CBS 690.94]|uniref:DUF6604 domain-containing protein n=1 Tax=Karstenula rhodostoma CBS 690.94 TaxID=1392251 RepID=A0A9P4PG38_9PLEO|nr:hypothetical protein P171DRAFT_486082 [Karstenula rhodostoma CBS 690.94]